MGVQMLDGRTEDEVVGIVCAGFVFFDGLAFGIPSTELIDFLLNRNAYLFDPTQPQNGVTYLPPPFKAPKPGDPDSKTDDDPEKE